MSTVVINSKVLSDLLTGTVTASCKDMALPSICGVFLDAQGGKIRTRATDRYRMIEGKAQCVGDFKGALLSLLTIKQILAGIKMAPKNVDLTLDFSPNSALEVNPFVTSCTHTLTIWYGRAGIANVSSLRIPVGDTSTFPDTDKTMSKCVEETPISEISLNPHFLADLRKIPASFGDEMVLTFFGDGKPVVATVTHDVIEWKALIMPKRYDKKVKKVAA